VRDLVVIRSRVGPPGAQAIAGSRPLARLSQLVLDGGPLGDGGLASLATAPLSGLRLLSLEGSGITDEGVRELLASESLGRLKHLNLKKNTISKEMKRALRERYGQGVCTFSR